MGRREGEDVVLGFTDVGQTWAGTIQHVSFTRRAVAGGVGPGESLAVLESAKCWSRKSKSAKS